MSLLSQMCVFWFHKRVQAREMIQSQLTAQNKTLLEMNGFWMSPKGTGSEEKEKEQNLGIPQVSET